MMMRRCVRWRQDNVMKHRDQRSQNNKKDSHD
jgi:hypothetical protein